MWQFNGILVTHDTLERICPNRTDRTLIRLQLQNSNIFTPYFYISFYTSTTHSQPICLICKAHFNIVRAITMHFLVTSLARETSEYLIPKGIKLTLHPEGRALLSCELRHKLPPGHVPSSVDSINSFTAEIKGSRWTVCSRSCFQRGHPQSKWLSHCE